MIAYSDILEAVDNGMLVTVIAVTDPDGDAALDVMGWILGAKAAERAWRDSPYGVGLALAILPERRKALVEHGYTLT